MTLTAPKHRARKKVNPGIHTVCNCTAVVDLDGRHCRCLEAVDTVKRGAVCVQCLNGRHLNETARRFEPGNVAL